MYLGLFQTIFSGGGDRFKPAMVDQFNDRPKTSLPMTKLPKQKFAWNQNITEDNLKILNNLDENERNTESKSLFKGTFKNVGEISKIS